MLLQLEYTPILIQAHRDYLRSLAAPPPEGVVVTSRREAIGRLIVRLGRWIERCSPDCPPTPLATGT